MREKKSKKCYDNNYRMNDQGILTCADCRSLEYNGRLKKIVSMANNNNPMHVNFKFLNQRQLLAKVQHYEENFRNERLHSKRKR